MAMTATLPRPPSLPLGADVCMAAASAPPPPKAATAPLDGDRDGWFAIARVNGAIRLVQVSTATPSSPLTTLDVKVFRHEFIHIFRFLESRTLHPADIHILERIPPASAAHDPAVDADTVSLARDVLARLSRLTAPMPAPGPAHGYGYGYGYGRGHARHASGGAARYAYAPRG